jgi:hypothetical protein
MGFEQEPEGFGRQLAAGLSAFLHEPMVVGPLRRAKFRAMLPV